MFNYIKSLFVRNEQIITNLHIIDDKEDKYDVAPNVRLFVPCRVCNCIKHINIKCC